MEPCHPITSSWPIPTTPLFHIIITSYYHFCATLPVSKSMRVDLFFFFFFFFWNLASDFFLPFALSLSFLFWFFPFSQVHGTPNSKTTHLRNLRFFASDYPLKNTAPTGRIFKFRDDWSTGTCQNEQQWMSAKLSKWQS